ncbi:mammalian cell entry protein [Mycolicibacterium litorale]|nr:mammalian cell entry protein [Mycolicibacterium litorale]
MTSRRPQAVAVIVALIAVLVSGCGWHGLNSLPLPGTAGHGPGSYEISAQLPDVDTLKQNSRVRVGDVTVGSVTKIERQGWHALVSMTINGDVDLPANATATVGQTSLLGTQHVELAAPKGVAPQGRLTAGSVIPLSRGAIFPTVEQTLATMSLLFNGGGLGQLQDITKAFTTAGTGREDQLRSLLQRLAEFTKNIDAQTTDILAATDSLNNLAGQFADQDPVLTKALQTIPNAVAVLSEERTRLTTVLDRIGTLGALTAESVDQTKRAITEELKHFATVLKSLADAGPALTRSLGTMLTFPWPAETIDNWVRGDYANATLVLDLTLSRLDSTLFTGTRWEGNLTELEMQWGRTIGQIPSPYTADNPLLAPYRHDQGP